jgi:phospholipase C
MEVLDRGFSFQTFHEPAGNVAHVRAAYRRFQTQAPIRRTQKFEMEFFGRGAGMELGVMALPRRATPQAMTAVRRERAAAVRTMEVATTASSATATSATTASAPILARTIAAAGETTVAPAATTTDADATAPAISTRSTVQPDFQSPFDRDWIDWDLEPPTFPDPTDPPGGGGGGGGGLFHGQVLIELFLFGADQPVQTWLLEEGVGPRIRKVKFELQGFPTPDSPMLRTGWWRMVVTPIGPDPVEVEITADVFLGDVPIRTTPLAVRLANHLFRVGLEALVPNAEVDGSTARVSIGPEIAELLGAEPLLLSESISPASSNAKLRSLNITTISGAELHTIAREHYKERAKRTPIGANLSDELLEQLAATLFKSRFLRLAMVQPDYVCIRIQAAFSNASVSVSGFDVASLRGELGEFIIAFDRTLTRVLPFSFLDVRFSTLASIAIEIISLFTEVPTNVNALIEQLLSAQERHILKYVRLFVGRAVGLNSFVHEFKLQNGTWQIRHSDDPLIPRPGDPVLPPVEGGPLDGGVIAMMARGGVFGEMPSVPQVEVPAPPSPAPIAAAALPTGFLPPPEKLALLDQHKSIVVVMMENRSYDHMLGDLMNARPRTTNPYDGAPAGIQNAGVAGFLRGVPTVHTRDIRIGTAIPVSPAHSFNPVQFQIGDGTEEGRSTGDMRGFARDLYRRTDSPQLALTVYGEADLPVYYKLADEFCVCDRWFAAHPGPTWPNRFATIMGRIAELDNFEIDDPRIGYLKFRNVFDVLTGAGIDWRVFESDLSLVRMFDRYRLDDRHVVPIDDETDGLEATLRKPGPLPRVMFVEPNFTDIPPLKTANDDLAPTDLKHGQAFISRICDLIWDTGRFRDVLLVITYDEHGGFFDHVPPPGTPRGEPKTFAPLIEGGPTFPGVRVPAFVISPFVSAGKAEKTIFDHTSILKTILLHNRDRLGENTLTSFGQRVNEIADLSAVLDLTTPRQNPEPFVRRRPGRPGYRFGELVDFASVLELSSSFVSGTPSTTQPGTATPYVDGQRTPRVITVTERVPTPSEAEDPSDFHMALARMLRPRNVR